MADSARPPVAVRIVRPYETEEAFFENELETVGKTSVILIGAQSRPNGVILRFEVMLANGTSVLRGEGRVLAYKENAFKGQAGLALRFTRLDPKSKAFIDRAAAIRDARLSGEHPVAPAPSSSQTGAAAPASAPEPPASAPEILPESIPAISIAEPPPDPVLAEALTAPTPEPPVITGRKGRRSSLPPERRSERPRSVAPIAAMPEPVAEPEAAAAEREPAPAPEPEPVPAAPPSLEASPRSHDREAAFARLRQRAAAITPEKKAAILGS